MLPLTPDRPITPEGVRIPSQSSPACHAALRRHASALPAGCGVELGAWLGATTRVICEAAPQLELHSYDRWRATSLEAAKARAQGLALGAGADTLPIWRAHTAGLRAVAHRGDIRTATWIGAPITLHVDDACKTPALFEHALRIFARSWIAGVTVVALLDLWYYERFAPGANRERLRHQARFIEAHAVCFEWLCERPALLRYRGGLR